MSRAETLLDDSARAAARLPPLLVEAEKVAHGVITGGHGRRRSGPGESFWQFRNYMPGDEPRSINWRKSAQGDRLLVRETEWAAAQSVWLWRDASPSMQFRSHDRLPTKRHRAEVLLLALSCLLARGGERMALIGEDVAPSGGKPALARMASRLGHDAAAGCDIPDMRRDIASGSHIVMMGDFLSSAESYRPFIRGLANLSCRGILVQVLDPAETAFPYRGRVDARGCENDGRIVLPRAEAIRDIYLSRLAGHQHELLDMARGLGWDFLVHETADNIHPALLALYTRLVTRPHR